MYFPLLPFCLLRLPHPLFLRSLGPITFPVFVSYARVSYSYHFPAAPPVSPAITAEISTAFAVFSSFGFGSSFRPLFLLLPFFLLNTLLLLLPPSIHCYNYSISLWLPFLLFPFLSLSSESFLFPLFFLLYVFIFWFLFLTHSYSSCCVSCFCYNHYIYQFCDYFTPFSLITLSLSIYVMESK